MAEMSHRERILRAINHQEPDRVPVDIGGTFATTLTIPAFAQLAAYKGWAAPSAGAMLRRSRSVLPPEEALRDLDVDCRALNLGAPDNWRDVDYPDGSFVDEWGVRWSHAEGGHYIDTASPLRYEAADIADLAKVKWPDPHDPGRTRGLRAKALQLREETRCAVILNLPFFPEHYGQWERGYGQWLTDIMVNQEYWYALTDRILEIQLAIVGAALDEVGDAVDIVAWGDDLGYQGGPMMSLELYRRTLKPAHRRMMDLMKSRSKAKVLFHSCGSVYAFIPDLIDIGVDILNPIQVAAKDMDSARLKREFGRDLCFWGGIDTQRVMPAGTPQEVREEVKRRIEHMAAGGGYVVATVHNIQAEVPPENVLAMIEAAHEFGRYR